MARNPSCDVCEMQRASLYCEADEAYLCQECDASVHGANTLASRHKRISFKREEEEHENTEDNEGGDGVCPGNSFQTFADATSSVKASALDLPLGGIRIGDITFARVASHAGHRAASSIGPGRKEEDEPHQVPRFVPVAQELPCLEPFRFHSLAANNGAPPARNTRFMSLLEGEAADPDGLDQETTEEDGAQENQELGVVPDLISPRLRQPAATTAAATPKNEPKVDKEREARVNRYREKRRTRMFSKKIRYEVRKIYAENRPRLKGRFVRRTNDIESLQCLWSEDQVQN